ncbi:MAG: hypothetical protein KDC92_13935, partial [Bacteroidetes bacterium]|nr:hypothetical protein [Bacteroidota bacterium]
TAPVLTQTTYESLSQIRLQVTKSNSPDIDKYNFIRSTNGGSFATIATITSSASSLTYIDNISNDGTNSYCYRVTGIDECGNRGDTSALHCPVNLSARTGQLESILEWKPYVGYELDSATIQRFDSVNNKWNRIGRVGATDTFFKDSTNIICNYLYTYRIASHQKNGTLVTMSDSAGVRPIDTIKPPRIELITTGILSQASAGVVFLRSPDSDVNQHMVVSKGYYNGKLVSTDSAYTFDKSPDTIQAIVSIPRTDSISYRFQVFAIDSCNQNVSANSETHHAIQVTGKPLNLATELNWSHYKGWGFVSAYVVQVYDGNDWKAISNLLPNTTTFTHTGLPCNLEQRYRIIGIGNSLLSEGTISDEIRLTPYDSLPPKAPVVNYATVVNDSTIEINWNQSTSGDAQNYLVFMSRNGGAPIFLDTVARTTNPTHTYTCTGINTKTHKYCFEILAFDTCNLNISTDHVKHCAMQLDATAGNKEVMLNWSPYEGLAVKQYEIQQLVNNNWVSVATVAPTVSSYKHTNLNCYVPYTYRIKMTETGTPADNSLSDTITVTPFDTIAPDAPRIRSVSVLNNNSVEIKWDHSVANDVYKYVLHQKHPDSTHFSVLDTLGYVNKYTASVDASKIDLGFGFALQAIDNCRDNVGVLSNPTSTIVLDVRPQDCENVLELNWRNNPNFKEGLNQYEIYRSENSGAYVLIAISNGNNYLDSVIPYFTYQYYIKATENNSTGYNAISNTELGVPYRPYAPVVKSVSVSKSGIIDGEIEVKWHINTKADYLERQKIYHKESGSANFSVLNNNLAVTDSAFTHSNINTKTTNHEYFVVTEDSCGNISDTVSIHKSIDFEFKIGQLTHELRWTPYAGVPVARYYVEQLQGNSFVVTDTVSPTKDSLFKFPAPCNTLITYRIGAESALGFISYSDTASGLAIDNEYPDKPILTNISVTNTAINTINFMGVDSPDVFAYQILRSANGGNFVHRGYMPYTGVKKAEQFIDSVKKAKGPYRYAVVALDSCLNGASTDTFKTSQLNGVADHFKNTLFWNKFEGYALNTLQLQTYNGTAWSLFKSLNVNDTHFVHQDASCGASIIYRLMGISAKADTTYSNQISLTPTDTTPPLSPLIKYATVDAHNRIKLYWTNPANNDVKTYNIYRSDNGGPFNLLNDTTYTNVYYDNHVKSQSNYYNYYIEAIDSCIAQPSPFTDTVGTFYFSIEKDTCQTENRYQIEPIKHLGNGADYYILFYKSANSANWKGIDSVYAGTTTYIDTARIRD